MKCHCELYTNWQQKLDVKVGVIEAVVWDESDGKYQ